MQHRPTNPALARRPRDAARALTRLVVFVLVLLPALAVLGAVSARPATGDAVAATPSPATLTGRLHRQSDPGAYIDHGAPLAPWEARLVSGYRAPRGD